MTEDWTDALARQLQAPDMIPRAEADAMVAAALEEAINRVNGCDRVSEVQPAIRALIEDPSILAKRDARMKAEGMREAARVAAIHNLGRDKAAADRQEAVILARAAEIEKGET